MVNMLFYIRFRAQLRRTRPEIIASLENVVTQAAAAAGGIIETRHKILTASFDENRIGFWLGIVIFLENVHKALEQVSRELSGYALVLGRDTSESAAFKLCRAGYRAEDSSGEKDQRRSVGIWVSEDVSKVLNYYMMFAPAKTLSSPLVDSDSGERATEKYRELLQWRSVSAGKPAPSHRRPQKAAHNIPPLRIRFGATGNPLVCFADAYTPQIRSLIATAAPPQTMEELDTAYTLLFKERLRQELSPYMTHQVQNFIRSLLTAYGTAAKTRVAHGMLVLESLHLAENAATIFRDAYRAPAVEKLRLAVAAANSAEKSVALWSGALNCDIAVWSDDSSVNEKNALRAKSFPQEVFEVAYNISLLGQYFPEHLIPELFEAEGLSREMYCKTLAMLVPDMQSDSGVFTKGTCAVSAMPTFAFYGEKTLRAGKEKIRRMVRKIILAWVSAGKLRPCFNLLTILADLGERAGDDLILRAIKSDVLNGTSEAIAKSIKKGQFSILVGAANAPVLSYIYKTLTALASGNVADIQRVFQEPVPPMSHEGTPCYQAYQAQVQVNLAAFYIGTRNNHAASEAVRKAMTLNLKLGKSAIPVHRLFSLVYILQQRIDDALEYIAFAAEQAERTEQDGELAITYYFAASFNFLHGNLSKAERLAVKAEQAALSQGQGDWAMWARFLLGKITFEIGRYNEALAIFQSIETLYSSLLEHSIDGAGSADGASNAARGRTTMVDTLRAWIYRARAFLGNTSARNAPVHNADAGFDGTIFTIEAAYLSANYERANDLAEQFLSPPGNTELHSEKQFLFTEQPDFKSGFAQCENILLGGKHVGERIAWIYRNMSQCALHPSQEAKAEILGGMQRFMRDELLPDTDPNDSFSFYAWYCMLRDTNATQMDMNTIVSMAHRRLQRRASRIDDVATMQTFLKQSSWNSTLRLAARDYNLI